MTPYDHKLLYTALAFVLAAINEPDDAPNHGTLRILHYAGQLEAFCAANNGEGVVSAVEHTTADETDGVIERHVRALKEREETRLAEDRESLIRLHDRLQHRKARRALREVYAFSPEARLSDMVLTLLDEEIYGSGEAVLM
jgi:hypothetical protein